MLFRSLKKIFQARSEVLRVIREYFYEENFVETNTPKMIATATEGGAALFPIFYYNSFRFRIFHAVLDFST